jgi:regulator of replication initiation timing
MPPTTSAHRTGPPGADEAACGRLVAELDRLAQRVEATAALVGRLRRRLDELERENRALLLERDKVSARLTALIEKVDLLSTDS